MRTLLLPLLLLVAPSAVVADPATDEVLIYRCTDSQGRLALQDFPCASGEQQQIRSMIRPQDPPPAPPSTGPETAASPAPAADTTAETGTIARVPARPMYECVTPDGERYLSDDGSGNPRPAPVWGWGAHHAGPTPGVPPGPRSAGERRAAGIASPGMSTSPGPSLTAPARPPDAAPPPRPRPPRPGHPLYGAGGSDGWIRDTCHPLPQNQVCTLLGDRRTEIRRRIFNAQPSERAVLREEDRDITTRLNRDCGIR